MYNSHSNTHTPIFSTSIGMAWLCAMRIALFSSGGERICKIQYSDPSICLASFLYWYMLLLLLMSTSSTHHRLLFVVVFHVSSDFILLLLLLFLFGLSSLFTQTAHTFILYHANCYLIALMLFIYLPTNKCFFLTRLSLLFAEYGVDRFILRPAAFIIFFAFCCCQIYLLIGPHASSSKWVGNRLLPSFWLPCNVTQPNAGIIMNTVAPQYLFN